MIKHFFSIYSINLVLGNMPGPGCIAANITYSLWIYRVNIFLKKKSLKSPIN